MDRLTSLLDRYATAEPRRAHGGLYALSGFDYQLRNYLADLVSMLLRQPIATESIFGAFETLSDYVRNDADNTVCVQVKTRITRSTLVDAAREFVKVDAFLEREDPALWRQTFYEVVGGTRGDDLGWDDLSVPPADGERFRQMRATRMKAIRIEPDPWWKLIVLLFPHVKDPFGFARWALERCLSVGTSIGEIAELRNEIAERLGAERQPQIQAPRFVSAADVCDTSPSNDDIVLAKTPTLDHVRSGQFMPRQRHVEQLVAVLDTISERNVRAIDQNELNVLWIDGRSGVGKSVLLLQLLQYVVRERGAAVVWLDRAMRRLPLFLSQLAATTRTHPAPDFVFVDDLYDPQSRDDFDVHDAVTTLVRGGGMRWPVLVTCGPTEFRDAFERDCRGEGFRVYEWELPPLKPQETLAVREWFRQRFGRVSKTGSAARQDRALFLSLMFELQHGDLRPFAHRFRIRIEEQHLVEALRVPLALNRLYVWSPTHWFTDDERRRLRVLNQDGDFAILPGEESGGLLRLTHPHLSDAIYSTIYGENASDRAADLVHAFARALADSMPTAMRLLRATSSGGSRMAKVDAAELATGMISGWRATLARHPPLPRSSVAEMWSLWARWSTRERHVTAALGTDDPVSESADALAAAGGYRRWASVWLRLWDSRPGDSMLVSLARWWLDGNRREYGWARVWCVVTDHAVAAESNSSDTGAVSVLLEMGWLWLNADREAPGWTRVWEVMLKHRTRLDGVAAQEIVARGRDWQRDHPTAIDWNYVWQALYELELSPTARQVDRQWIESIGLERMLMQPDNPGWPFVWQKLGRKVTSTDAIYRTLIQLAEQWLASHIDDPAWPYVRVALARTRGRKGQIRSEELSVIVDVVVAQEALRWHSVFHLLIVAPSLTAEDRLRLIKVGRPWLFEDVDAETVAPLWEIIFRWLLTNAPLDTLDQEVAIGMRLLADIELPIWSTIWISLNTYLRRATRPHPMVDEMKHIAKHRLGTLHHMQRADWINIYVDAMRLGLGTDPSFAYLVFTALPHLPTYSLLVGVQVALRHAPSAGPLSLLSRAIERWFQHYSETFEGTSSWLKFDRCVRDRFAVEPGEYLSEVRATLDACRPDGVERWNVIRQMYVDRQSVEGRIVKTTSIKKKKEGFLVDIGITAFLPLEEADIRPTRNRHSLVGRQMEFAITRFDEALLQVDVSHKRILQQRRVQWYAKALEGDVVDAVVRRVGEFIADVEIGCVDAHLVVRSSGDSKDPLISGMSIRAKILLIDRETGEVTVEVL
ncbi:MAG: hypothetical protein ACJ74H_19625 [Thermoanaerobaculia bacterium]